MAYVDIGDYRYATGIAFGNGAAVQVRNKTQTSYGNILSQVNIDGRTYNVTHMLSCFRGCVNFNQSITIPDSVINMGYCFEGCTNFNQPITIPDSVVEMHNCFANCTNFNSTITFTTNASVTDMTYCFYGCTNFNQPITIPDSVTDISYCFYGCTNFNQFTLIPENVTDMRYCFYNCTNFNQPITIPESVGNMRFCFYKCLALANNITIKGSPIEIDNIFYDTGLPIYIINEADESIKDGVATHWRRIASEYLNVHYEIDDHTPPLISIEAKRVDENGQADSAGTYVKIDKKITIYSDFIPYDYEPPEEFLEDLTINGDSRDSSLTIHELAQDYAEKQIIVYTLHDRYKETSTTAIVSKILALLDFQGYKGRLYNDMPGMGMAIGKKAERNGLEINFPTAIGTGLTPATKFEYDPVESPTGNPSEQGWYEKVSEEEYVLTEDTTVVSGKTYYEQREGSEYVDLENTQLIVGNYNIPVPNSVFIIGNGTENEPSNSFWIRPNGTLMFRNGNYADGVGAMNAGLTFIDKNGGGLGFLKAYAEEYDNKLYEGMTFGSHKNSQYNTLRLMCSEDGKYCVSFNGRNAMGISSNIQEAWQKAIGLDAGHISVGEVAANSYKDVTISYSFSSAPKVVATLFSSGTAANIGNVTVSVHSITNTSAKVRIFNNRSATISPAIEWIAMLV